LVCRRPDDIRDIDRRRERSADRRREPERSGRGSSHGGDRDVRHPERGRDPRALGRDADPRARGSGADRDWGHRGPTRQACTSACIPITHSSGLLIWHP